MKTTRLIDMIAADSLGSALPMVRVWLIAGAVALFVAAAVFFGSIGPIPDFVAASATPRFLLKFVATLTLLVTAFSAMTALARPGAALNSVFRMLLMAPALLVVAVVLEIIFVPTDQLANRWLGTNALLCMMFVPLIGIGPLAAALIALRQGAPTRPALAGAIAGLASGSLAATFYAAHCFDDSPLFVATWYPAAIILLAGAGALAGRVFLRW